MDILSYAFGREADVVGVTKLD